MSHEIRPNPVSGFVAPLFTHLINCETCQKYTKEFKEFGDKEIRTLQAATELLFFKKTYAGSSKIEKQLPLYEKVFNEFCEKYKYDGNQSFLFSAMAECALKIKDVAAKL
jgi:uncharacterized membrane protein